MKDFYSFSKNEEKNLKSFMKNVLNAYVKIFKRVGIGHKTYTTLASGGSFYLLVLLMSFRQFLLLVKDTIYIDEEKEVWQLNKRNL